MKNKKLEDSKKYKYKYEIKEQSGVSFINIKKSNGFEVILADLGAAIYQIKFNDEIMTLTPKFVSDFKRKDIYHGKTIGRYSNRIKNGKILVANTIYNLDRNEGENTLHSGSQGFSNKYFDFSIEETDDFFIVIFTYLSPDLDAGFPGEVDFKTIYFFPKTENNYITIQYLAKTDYETLLRPTNHSYFTLGENDIANIALMSFAPSSFAYPDEKDLLYRRMESLPLYFSFKNKRVLLKDLYNIPELVNQKAKGVDHYFKFEKVDPLISSLILEGSKYFLALFTDFEGLQIYTDNYEDNVIYKNTTNKSHRGVAIEPSDSPFKSNILKPFEKFERFISYEFGFKDDLYKNKKN